MRPPRPVHRFRRGGHYLCSGRLHTHGGRYYVYDGRYHVGGD